LAHGFARLTIIQRFGGGLNLNVYYQTMLFDGVLFTDHASGSLHLRPLPPPMDEEVSVVLARVAARVRRVGADPDAP
jgi:hypothetical protein